MTSQRKIKIPFVIIKKNPPLVKEKLLELPVPNVIVPPKTSSLENEKEIIIDINQDDLDTFIV